jgi:A/G-specific adenine glycosylase
MPASMRATKNSGLAVPLLRWFSRARRALPWREEPRDPYRTWISEVMAQQTRLDVVVPYFHRFVARFPTLRHLAQAPEEDVLALWSGLGYYARARNLHRAARAANGNLPRTFAALSDLPGFGPYTAAAVASLAFGEDVPLVDGNVARVLARVLHLEGDALQVRKPALEAAARLLPKGSAGPFNEALMELGATLCTPRAPRCGECPLKTQCAAGIAGDAESFPAPKKQRVRPELHWAALDLRRSDGAVLLARRGDEQLFAGLWELPSTEAPPAADAAEAARHVLRHHGLPAKAAACVEHVGRVQQTLTHRQITLRLFRARLSGRFPALGPSLRWIAPDAAAFSSLGISSLAAKALRACGLPP